MPPLVQGTLVPNRGLAELLERTLVVVAHPDDECIGAGALLQKIREPVVVFCTDGGPRDPYFWGKYGSRENYVELRRKEALAATAIVGVKAVEFLPIVDQDLYKNLNEAWQRLIQLVSTVRPQALLTMAYEGGHPDHDSCAFLSHRLGVRLKLPVWEFPIYHLSGDGPRKQQFVKPEGQVHALQITASELQKKQQMVAAYPSQGLQGAFDLTIERFRPQANYDFSQPPTSVTANYEAWQWPITTRQVCEAFAEVSIREDERR